MKLRHIVLPVSLAAILFSSWLSVVGAQSSIAGATDSLWKETGTEKAQPKLQPTRVQAQAAQLSARFLTQMHYKRVPLDDAMSAQILKRFIESLDSEKLFFLQSDMDAFAVWENKLDDAIQDEDLEAPFEIFKVYLKRIAERTDYSRSLLKTPFDFTAEESYTLSRKEAPWAKDNDEVNDLWRKRVKNDWLRLKLAKKKPEAIVETLDKRYRSLQTRMSELDSEDIFQSFMNAYAYAIEPHTGYLAPRASENFNISMRLSLQGIGAQLQRDEDYTVVREVIKGGPASQEGTLRAGDRIVSVAQGDKGKPVDVVGWRVDDVVELIRGKKDTIVRLEVLPKDAGPDGPSVPIKIKRDTVKLEEQAAKKSIIEIESAGKTRKIGVISLPTFYHDFDAQRRGIADYRSSTRDVKSLILALKFEKVEGIVIDLRDNGGGSLQEATSLTGLFIDKGPVVQVKDTYGKISVEADKAPGTAWDGPLAVLVNRASASASEIFAAAIQDYGRGIIIGETTYGKGTVQNLVDLDSLTRNEDNAKFGQLRLTVAQFFRVDGGSTQHKGVVPDLAYPSTWDHKDFGESALDNALPWTKIDAAKFSAAGDNMGTLANLLSASHKARVAENSEYKFWLEDLAEYRRIRNQTEISLVESVRKTERDALEKRKADRKVARGGTDTQSAIAQAVELDDGQNAGEGGIEVDAEDEKDEPDVLLTETANVLMDAIDLLHSDQSLAARVKGFSLTENVTVH